MTYENYEIVNGPIPVNQITLETWDKYAPVFLENIQLFTNETASTLIKNKLDDFRLKLEQPSAENPANFTTLRQECRAIIAERVPDYQTPHWQNALSAFFKVFLIALVIALAVGIAMMFSAKVSAIVGLITITSFNFKALATTALSIALGAGVATTLSMFAPKFHANLALTTLSNGVNSEAPATLPANTI